MTIKVVIIGGGSSYTPEIIEGFIERYHNVRITEIVLVDIPTGKAKLETIASLAKRMVKKSQLPIRISYTFHRREALIGADFVTTQIRVGGLEARIKDERIPLKHGFVGQETNGAGGIFKAFRTIPILLNIASDMHELCPDAWLINFTNPAGIVTEAVIKHSPHKRVIGVCNIPFNMKSGIAKMFDCDVRDIEIEFVGMNHFIFGKTVWLHGENVTDEALKRLVEYNQSYSPANIVSLGWSKPFIESLKMVPNPYHQYYFQTKEVLEKDLQAFQDIGTRAEVVQQVEINLFETYQDTELMEKPKELEQRGGAYYSDAACNLIESIYTNKQDIQTVNTFNNGAISDLKDDDVIEVNAVITSEGPRPLTIGSLPNSIKGLITKMKNMEHLVIQAATTGDYNQAYLALLMNPLVANEKKAKTLLDELLEAHKDYLPQFNLKEEKIL
ncbi:6-phospho-beta-glucosidase [Salipaludibacillus agaradhaerens]|uniref:6-phospho-beta-glucosidase n=1 Tax=Salipaludibacillus agaradhaerens TaxID=76935 RepID=A0A9Q4AZ62_SALAG|nr:6-phospho-beta-glucosidase [Salipaludibacillus agaradhaerens]MCR6095095.1 6-phospho-beta-glucosidase [Salipaludibacillus agaradhaerens]MCR6115347.1 6-phospho-beta-glucosidase [Salipaludibacillus agaradhaerens]